MKINCDTSSISPMDGMMRKIRAAQESEIGQYFKKGGNRQQCISGICKRTVWIKSG
jgi:hypothetical protein